jgi:hypothetical protein
MEKILTSILYKYVGPILAIFYFCANIVAFKVFLRKKIRKTSLGTYSCITLIGDSFGLMLFMIEFLNNGYEINFYSSSLFTCKITFYLLYAFGSLSPWSLALLSLDRMSTLRFAGKVHFLKKKSFQIFVSIVITIYNLIYYIDIAINRRTFYAASNHKNEERFNISLIKNESAPTHGELTCDMDEKNSLTLFIMDFFNFSIIPFIIMSISTWLILIAIFKSKTASNCSNRKISSKNRNLAFTTVILNVCFLILTLPINTYYIIASLAGIDYRKTFMNCLFDLLFYSNHGIVFFVNVIMNKMFRSELLLMFRFRSKRKRIVQNQKRLSKFK